MYRVVADSLPFPVEERISSGGGQFAPESELICRARAGDENAFRELWLSAERRVVGICFILADHDSAALDAVQDTQIAVWRNLHRFEGRSSFSTWACAIARNAVHDARRREAARREVFQETQADTFPEHHTTADFTDQLLHLLEVRQALTRLRQDHREALLLWSTGMTYEEVSRTLDAPVQTVRVWVHRARNQLRSHLASG
jgi:RNA polymerase sigma factor (sigma-70 family)